MFIISSLTGKDEYSKFTCLDDLDENMPIPRILGKKGMEEKDVERKEILKNIAPCSLMCYTCCAYDKGVICNSSRELSHYTEGIREFYEKHLSLENTDYLERFSIFQEELIHFGTPKCKGCRNDEHNGCSIKDCFISECVKVHSIDFCGECAEFPCDKTQAIFEEEVYLQWMEGNKKIRELGAELFWKQDKETPHYKRYRKLD